jgi:hypothetical protein
VTRAGSRPARRPARRLLAGSLALNLVLLALWAAGRPRPLPDAGSAAEAAPPPAEAAPAPAAVPAAPAGGFRTNLTAFTWAHLADADLARYRDNLRAVGCPEPVLRDALTAELEARFPEPSRDAADATNFWATGPARRDLGESAAAAQRERAAARRAAYRDVLGMAPPARAGAPSLDPDLGGMLGRVFLGHVTEATRERVLGIVGEFQDYLREFRESHPRPWLERELEAAKRWVFSQEQALELALTPADRDEARRRMAGVLLISEDEVRDALAAVRPSAAELRELAGAVPGLEHPLRLAAGADLNLEEWENADEDELLLRAEPGFHAVLGDERYARYDRERTRMFRDVREFAAEHRLPVGTAEAVFAELRGLRDEARARAAEGADAAQDAALAGRTAAVGAALRQWLANVPEGEGQVSGWLGRAFENLPPKEEAP